MDGRLRVLALIAGIVLMHAPDAGAAFPKPQHTNKTRFRIPFKFDSTALQRMEAREVQLHVSRDHGETWGLTQSLTPDGGKFEYLSPADGEYWFSVKTLDGRSQLHPPRGTYETGLIVVVDTTPPELELSLKQAEGKAQLSWRASDTNLDPNTLKIESLAPEGREWESVNVAAQGSGEHSWSLHQNGIVSVRGSISDLAGNVGDAKARLNVDGVADPQAKQRPVRRGPIADGAIDDGKSSSKNESLSAALPPDPAVGEQEYQGPVITPQGSLHRYQKVSDKSPQSARAEFAQDQWPTTTNAFHPIPSPTSQMELGYVESGRAIQRTPQLSQRAPVIEAPAQRRQAVRQRIVTSRQFQINYTLDDVGPSGVGAVEFFITEDNGRKWWKYEDDPDKKSPFDVEVPHDGVYGFAIRVISGAGLANEPPVPGEAPAYIVAVDQTAPTVELLPLQQGKGTNANRVLIRWKVTEDHPSEKPVALYYAPNANGPWEPIGNLKEELAGSFEWVVGPAVPSRVYVRVVARDAAGNVGKAETQAPIIVDLVRPSVRIVDIETPALAAPQ